jgi:hypothetical protein
MPRTNPDGDVELPGADYNNFNVPECAHCVAEGRDKSIVSCGGTKELTTGQAQCHFLRGDAAASSAR